MVVVVVVVVVVLLEPPEGERIDARVHADTGCFLPDVYVDGYVQRYICKGIRTFCLHTCNFRQLCVCFCICLFNSLFIVTETE